MAATQPARESMPRKASNPARYQRARSLMETKPDWALVGIVAALIALGLVMAYSTTFYIAVRNPVYQGNPTALFTNHVVNLLIGIAAFIIIGRVDYGLWRRFALPIILVTIIVLLLVLILGATVFGATRSFSEGSIQPSELAKVTILCYGAAWLASRRDQLASFKNGLLPYAVIVGIAISFIVLQPDLSTTLVIVIASFSMLFLAGASVIQMGAISLVGAGVMAVMLSLPLFAHVQKRLGDFLIATGDYSKMHEHVQYAIAAVTDGGLFGRGIGAGYEKFIHLPAPHTDSVFPVLAQELGLIGVAVTLGLFVLLAYRGLMIAQRSDTDFGRYFSTGIIMWLLMQTVVNMLANVGLIPLPGVPVPFLSVGGSSMVAVMIACGVLFSISRGSRLSVLDEQTANGELLQRRTANGANTSISRWDSRTRAARSDSASATPGERSTSIIGRDVRFTPKLRRGDNSSVVRWRAGRDGAKPGQPRKR